MYEHANHSTAVSADRPSTEIENVLDRANNAVNRLHARVTAFEDRLRPVMRTTGSGVNGQAVGSPKESLSPLGDAIRSIEDRVDSAAERMEALLAGLAL